MSDDRQTSVFAPDGDFASLVDAALDDRATSAELARLRGVLRDDPAALEAYLEQAHAHALLAWRSGGVSGEFSRAAAAAANDDDAVARHPAGGVRKWRGFAAAAVLLMVGVAITVIVTRRPAGPTSPIDASLAVADVVDVSGVNWVDGQASLTPGAALPPGDVAVTSGTVRLNFRGDATVTIAGPARVRLVSATRLRAIAGRVTVRVGPAGKGFVVDAPGADVIDLGTEFGVQVGPAGETSVVVFDGAVDLTTKPVAPAATAPAASGPAEAPRTRLSKGQAVRVREGGALDRIVSVERGVGDGDWSIGPSAANSETLITSVRDNRRETGDRKFYRVVHRGLDDDAPAYVDRCYQWNGLDARGLPGALRGADLVMTFNDDKHAADLAITVTLARPATLYVLYKETPVPTPDWLARDFVRTDLRVGLDEGAPDMPRLRLGVGPGESVDHMFSVWRRDVPAGGDVRLGPNSPMHNSMYGIAAAPLK